ncbi:MAG: DegT/DnrJ/EryC1/StrS family aminotransferase [Desulfovibrio sp.]|nr:DegT/DnrJ/EryC1/StrS family aminotransferase [Desulfovibrio sp.]
MTDRINVVRSILPEREELRSLIDEVLDSCALTNNGPKCVEFEGRLKTFLGLDGEVTLCANGTLGLEIAVHAAEAAGKRIVTSPFTYVATVTAPLWVGCRVDFADIDPETLCVSPDSVAEKLKDDTAAVIPVNIYGHPCDDARLREICGDIPLVYDAAQAFGASINGRPLLDFGDFAVCSLHATKVMHSVEGGFVVSHTPEGRKRLCLSRAFGHINEDYISVGINAKMSEFHASAGLAVLRQYKRHLKARKKLTEIYNALLRRDRLRFPVTPAGFESNYGYFPVIFESESATLKVINALRERKIFPRRYFYPALTEVPYLNPEGQRCPIAEDVAKRVLCLPLYGELTAARAEIISEIVNKTIEAI